MTTEVQQLPVRRSQRTKPAQKYVESSSESTRKEPITRPRKKRNVVLRNEVIPYGQTMENELFNAIKDPEASMEELATQWLSTYKNDSIDAIGQLVNFLLKSCGCEVPIERHDLEEFDSAAETLAQVQDLAKDHTAMEYCLTSRRAEFKRFRLNLLEFIEKMVEQSSADLLYDDADFFENIIIWVTAMSSSHLRSFRHTSTVTLLEIMTVLLVLHSEGRSVIQKQTKLIDSSKKKKSPRSVVNNAKQIVKEENAKLQKLETMISEVFTTVFANRYKDIDPKIRTDCVKYLGRWMKIYPEKFLETQYLRYFGWLLSDESGLTRHQVVIILNKLYDQSEYQTALAQFTERFTSRLVEMAALDVEQSVRSTTVSLLVTIGSMGYLEDTSAKVVSSLIFDLEPRVRKSAAQFFLSQVVQRAHELFEGINPAKLSKLKETYSELQESWLTFKLTAEDLSSLENLDSNTASQIITAGPKVKGGLPRMVTAGEAIHAAAKILKIDMDWQRLADQLLFDFSSLKLSGPVNQHYVSNYSLDADQELILLDVLRGLVSAKLTAANETKSGLKRKAGVHEDANAVVSKLVELVPALLEKFRYSPESTAKVLALVPLLELNSIKQLRLESDFEKIFALVDRQFREQSVDALLQECQEIFMIVCQNEDMSILLSAKLQDTVEDVLANVRRLLSSGCAITSDECVGLLKKVVYLGSAISIHEVLNTVISRGNSLVQILIQTLREFDIHDMGMDFASAAVNLLRLFVVWKLGSLTLRQTASSLEAEDADVLTDIVEVLGRDLMSSDAEEIESMYKMALLEAMVVIKITSQQADLSSGDIAVLSRVPDHISDSCQRAILKVFLVKEKKYASAAGIELSADELNNELLGSEDDDGGESATEQNGNRSDEILELDFKLCEYAAKVNLASLANIIKPEYAERLKLNKKSLSIGYIELFKEHVNPLMVDSNNLESEGEVTSDV